MIAVHDLWINDVIVDVPIGIVLVSAVSIKRVRHAWKKTKAKENVLMEIGAILTQILIRELLANLMKGCSNKSFLLENLIVWIRVFDNLYWLDNLIVQKITHFSSDNVFIWHRKHSGSANLFPFFENAFWIGDAFLQEINWSLPSFQSPIKPLKLENSIPKPKDYIFSFFPLSLSLPPFLSVTFCLSVSLQSYVSLSL